MTLRTRVGLAGGAVVFVALALASLVLYPLLQANLRGQTDESLVQAANDAPTVAAQLKQKALYADMPMPGDGVIDLGSTLLQFLNPPVFPGPTKGFLDVTDQDVAVADRTGAAYFQDAGYGGNDYRVYTAPMPKVVGMAIRVARPLTDQVTTLNRLAFLLVVLTATGGVLAGFGARLAAGRVLRPVRVLTDTIEQVTATQDLTARIDVTGRDEIGRLGRSFAAMMSGLADSLHAQRQLVADASHELRTPLTSLTTNLELLSDGRGLRDPDAPMLVREAIEQAGELRSLVNDLIDLARYGSGTAHTEDTRLDLVADMVIARAAKRMSAPRFETALSPCLVHVDPDAIERAIGNLVDNAMKWSPPGGRVLVTVADGEFSIRDEGPGIPEADLPFVFGRFYRSAQARSMPGSGLGLAIVRQVVETHGGAVSVDPLDRGVRVRFTLPVVLVDPTMG